MIIAAKVIFCMFLTFWCFSFFTPNKTHGMWLFIYFESFVIAIAAGIIWGGLFQ